MINKEKLEEYELEQQIFLQRNSNSLNQKRYKMMRVIRNYDLLGRSLIDFMDLVFIILLVYLLVQKNLTIPLALVIYNYSGETTSIIFSLDNLFISSFTLELTSIFVIFSKST